MVLLLNSYQMHNRSEEVLLLNSYKKIKEVLLYYSIFIKCVIRLRTDKVLLLNSYSMFNKINNMNYTSE